MSDYYNLNSYGYLIETELGQNREGGIITWKAQEIKTQKTVVIKQFCFARVDSSWLGYKAYIREIEILQKLEHHNIPQYIDSIETSDGFCLVREYIAATPSQRLLRRFTTEPALTVGQDFRPLTTAEVMQVAKNSLDVLIYLQQQEPPILHQNISTDNILLDESLNVYLIDFSSSLYSHESVSSFKGTPGFIAPEQMNQPCLASDLYGLGVSLVCLLAHSDVTQVYQGDSVTLNQLNLNSLLPDLEPDFRDWLNKMTHPEVSQRFANAQSAQEALKSMNFALSWWENNTEDALVDDRQSDRVDLRPKIIGGVAISSLATIATWSIGFTVERVEFTFLTIAIATLATLAISVTQLGAASIVSSDDGAKAQGITLSVIIPTVLVCFSGLIWGIEEAIIIATAIALSETLLLSYFWWRLFSNHSYFLAKGGLWLSAIAIGITMGLKLI